MSESIIKVENISKRYRIGKVQQSDTLAEQIKNNLAYPIRNLKKITGLTRFREGEDDSIFWALKNINFEVKQGEVLGIIGHNGAGKSTLLKVLSRITEPTSGQITLKGRVSALLEVGTGFHPELSGRDNIYMNGTILGMSKREIDTKFDEIVAFSGIDTHLDTPVKFYSSGMRVRLAFSVAAHLEPEILVIDEVLAVGDAEFQKKCLGKMQDVAEQGRTVLFVSHDMSSIKKLCSRGILLKNGNIKFDGNENDAVNLYLSDKSEYSKINISDRKDRKGSQKLSFYSIVFGISEDKLSCRNVAYTGNTLYIHIGVLGEISDKVSFSIKITDQEERIITAFHTRFKEVMFDCVGNKSHIICKVPRLPFVHGKYFASATCIIGGSGGQGTGGVISDSVNNIASFEVLEGDYFGTGKKMNPTKHGLLLVDFEWYSL